MTEENRSTERTFPIVHYSNPTQLHGMSPDILITFPAVASSFWAAF